MFTHLSLDEYSRLNVQIEQDIDAIRAMGYHRHHSATARGYVSRRLKHGYITDYNGKYGKGYIIHKPRFDTTQYHTIIYMIKEA